MIRAADHRSPHAASAYPLALLGMVAALVCLLTEQVLPRWRARDASEAVALLRVQLAMAALAAAAWQRLENEDAGARGALALEDRAADMLDAMEGFMACVVRGRRAGPPRPPSTRRRGPSASPPVRAVALEPVEARARHGPPCRSIADSLAA